MSYRGVWLCCAALLSVSACKAFETTCDEDDRSCLGGGLGRSGEACVRNGDCATGMACRSQLCAYAGTTARDGKCLVSAECENGTYCSHELRCTPLSERPRAQGSACVDSADCARGLVCDLNLVQSMAQGPYGALDESCRERVTELESEEMCLLPRTCTRRGDKDFGTKCQTHDDCLAGLYCTLSPLRDTQQTTCLGGIELPAEPISLLNWAGGECPKDSETPTAYFEVPGASDTPSDFYRLPYPNDIRRSNRQIDLGDHPGPPPSIKPPVAARFLTEAASRNGFSTNPVVYFRFSTAIATGDLKLATVRIVDITPGSPEYNAPASIFWGPPERDSKYICSHWLSLYRPIGSPLRPNTTYAAIVTQGVRTKQLQSFERSADFAALLGKNKPADSTLLAAWEAYAPLRAWLADGDKSGVAADDLLNAAVFTTGDPTAIVPKLRAAVQADGVPQVKTLSACRAGVSSACAAADGRGACQPESDDFRELHGKLSLPIFQAGTAPYAEPQDGGGIALDGAGKPRVVRHEDVCFALSVPKTAAPASGWPLLIYAYAQGGVFNEAMTSSGVAGELARSAAHAAVLAIELPQHGARRGDSTRPPEDLLINLQNPAAISGNVLQGAADLFGAIALAGAGISAQRAPGGEAIVFDGSRLTLLGHGQGASNAALALSADDKVRSVVLASVAGHFATSLQRTKPAALAALLPLLLVDFDDEGRLPGGLTNPMLALLQSTLDVVDPINYADRLYRESIAGGRDVFLVYGRDDHFAPEPALDAYAKAANMPAVVPDLSMHFDDIPSPAKHNMPVGDGHRTVALRQYDPNADPVTPGEVKDGHFVVQANKTAHADVVRFLTQALAGEPPSIGR